MARIPRRISVTELRHDVVRVLERVRKSRQPLVVTRRGRPAAVLWSAREHERAEHERRILLALLRGQCEVADGVRHDLESVLAEADALLSDDR